MQHLGRPVGDLFEVRGVPLSATVDTVRDIIAHISWPATLQESYRRVHQGQAVFRARAEIPPSCELVKTRINQEIVHLQLARVHARKAVNHSAEKQTPAPQSWEQAAKQAIGIQKQHINLPDDTAIYGADDNLDTDGFMDAEFPSVEPQEPAPQMDTHKTWARRLQEPAAKLRRTEAGAELGADPRVDALVMQMEKVMTLLQGLAGGSITHDPTL